MKRYYIKRVQNFISITVAFNKYNLLNINTEETELKDVLVNINNMSEFEFYDYCKLLGMNIPTSKNLISANEEEDKWLKSAWSLVTKNTLEEIGLKYEDIPIDKIDLEGYHKLKNKGKKKAIKDNSIESTKEDKKPIKKDVESSEDKKEVKKVIKKIDEEVKEEVKPIKKTIKKKKTITRKKIK